MMNKPFETISPLQAKAWLSHGEAILVDVRDPDEFKAEHIIYAISLPLGMVCAMFTQLDLPKDRKIIFQCASGARSKIASVQVSARYQEPTLYNLDGGIDAWKGADLPVISMTSTRKISIIRQTQMIIGVLVLCGVLIGFAGLSWGFVVSGIFGAALIVAGLTGRCGLVGLLSCMPWNRT